MLLINNCMPKSIPTTGQLGVGNTAGVDRSINLLKNLRAGNAQNEPNSSINGLRNWFRDNVGTKGKVGGTLVGGSGSQVDVSDWRGVLIYGMELQAKNEAKNGTYWNGNDGAVRMKGWQGDQVNYRFTFNNKVKTVNYGVWAEFAGLDVGDQNGASKLYTAAATHRTDTSTSEDFQVKLFSVASGSPKQPQVIQWGIDNKTFDLSSNNGSGYTTNKVFVIGRQDLI